MRKFPSFRSAVKRIMGSMGHKPVCFSGNGLPKADIPGMVSSAEMAFFSESAARYFGREGAIVDLGCWLGSTSIALAQGILSHGSKADNRNEKVFGFDMFEWEAWMPAHIPYLPIRAWGQFPPRGPPGRPRAWRRRCRINSSRLGTLRVERRPDQNLAGRCNEK
jgi:hypothetical protein